MSAPEQTDWFAGWLVCRLGHVPHTIGAAISMACRRNTTLNWKYIMPNAQQDQANRRHLVAGNWKMNGTAALLRNMISNLLDASDLPANTDVLLLPPYPYLSLAADLIKDQPLLLGGQNLSEHEQGAYTGEVSAAMLAETGCEYVLVGHSERRELYAESDELVAEKFVVAQRGGLRPILCMGESQEQRKNGLTEVIVKRQLQAVLDRAGVAALGNAVLAYEPLWAIGTGKTASPEQAQEVHAYIRQTIAEVNARIAGQVQILYGGSVKADNAADLFAQTDIDGGLIGGASLQADQFIEICTVG
jgi:triosephosphate isomerase